MNQKNVIFEGILTLWRILSSEILRVRRDGTIGISTRYGLDDLEIESRYGRDFPQTSISALGVHPNSCIMGIGSLPCNKATGLWRWPPDHNKELSFLGIGLSTSQLGLCGVSRANFPFLITFGENYRLDHKGRRKILSLLLTFQPKFGGIRLLINDNFFKNTWLHIVGEVTFIRWTSFFEFQAGNEIMHSYIYSFIHSFIPCTGWSKAMERIF